MVSFQFGGLLVWKSNLFRKTSITIFLFLLLTKPAFGNDPLVFGVQPYLTKNELHKRFDPLVEHLSKELSRPVTVRVGRDYLHHIDYIGRKMVDLAFIGPAPYIKLTEKYGLQPLLARLETNGTPYYVGKIIVSVNSPLITLKGLKGKRFAFGDPDSTLSYLVPSYMLLKKGVKLEYLGGFSFLHSHNNVALGVLAGDYDAGAIKEEVFKKYAPKGLKAIATTPQIPEHVFLSRADFPEKLKSRVKKALFKLKETSQGRKILEGIKGPTTNITTAKDSDYDELRQIIKTLRDIGITP